MDDKLIIKAGRRIEDRLLYKKGTHTFKPGVSVLVGCNGAGKTTLLSRIREQLRKDPEQKSTALYEFYLKEETKDLKDKFFRRQQYELLALTLEASEGECINISTFDLVEELKKYYHDIENGKFDKKRIVVLVDSIDSGWSLDQYGNFYHAMDSFLKYFEYKSIPFYLIITSNTYELSRKYPSYDVQGASYVEFKGYDDYREFILKTRKYKDKCLGIKS